VLPNPIRFSAVGDQKYVTFRANLIHSIMVRRGVAVEGFQEVMDGKDEAPAAAGEAQPGGNGSAAPGANGGAGPESTPAANAPEAAPAAPAPPAPEAAPAKP